MSEPKRIAIAIGDPNGIGPEIALKAAAAHLGDPHLRPLLVGDTHVLQHYSGLMTRAVPLQPWQAAGVDAIAVEDVAALSAAELRPGTLSAAAGHATIAYAERAVAMATAGDVAAVIGCPQSETAINRAGIAFSGYPQLIADLTQTPRDRVFMMLVAGELRIAHCTLHESIATALSRLTPALVEAAGAATDRALRSLGFQTPRIAVCGINPHAGEDGLFGDEDERITKPAVDRLRARGIAATGPVGADLAISERRHDGYLVMFHDQGHIPIKLVSPRRASALAIGTPIVFSSVGHGCAYDIAGAGVAEHASVLETLAVLASVHRPAGP